MPNRLANETSPYLLQHKDNPVDWYPWGEEAFAEAKRRGVPIIVSIGYSTCHWCHVMARESFSDPLIAQLMNEHYVNIKVDREERPDVDAVYMQATQMLGYSTGWPLNVVLTPDGLPFFGGTYFPPTPRGEMPSFPQVLQSIADLWQRDRAKVIRGGQDVAKHVLAANEANPSPENLSSETLVRVLRSLYDKFDRTNGGFGQAPKFPQPTVHEFLLRHYNRTADPAALSIVELTLGAMAEGGIHDQIGGGFARYSVDGEWHVPHFEKMLYDNALLLPLYVDTYRHTGEAYYLEVAEGIVRWLQREMVLPQGGFAAALDADTDGEEGKFYVWTAAEVDSLFSPEDADLIKLHFGISDPGTFEGATVLRVVKPWEDLAAELGLSQAEVQNRLTRLYNEMLSVRNTRTRPHRDEKVIAAWNGMMIHALAYCGLALNKPAWIELAQNGAAFISRHMIARDGSVARSWANGSISSAGVLEDYANLAHGFISLYNATGTQKWLDTAWQLVVYTREHFAHESGIGFYDTPATTTDLFMRPRDLTDGATPSGNAVMAEVLLILGEMRRDDELTLAGKTIAESMASVFARHPQHLCAMALVAERAISKPREMVIIGKDAAALREAAAERIDPLVIWAYRTSDAPVGDWKILEDKPFSDIATAYWCVDYACKEPTSDPDVLRAQM